MARKIGLASDHAGKDLRKLVEEYLKLAEIEVVDFGVPYESDKSVDYPDFAGIVAQGVVEGKIDSGILVCGTGIGMSIAANKYPGVRAGVVWDEFSCRMARAHNNANILCLGSRTINHHRAIDLVRIWIETDFEGSRHQLRLDKIREIEKRNFNYK